MNSQAIKDIVNGTERKGINKYMLEEVYFSSLCEDDNANKYNPQNAHYENGRYYFDFPDLWYNHLSHNKEIGLRRIDLNADPLNIEFTVDLTRIPVGSGSSGTRFCSLSITARPSSSTLSVLEEICSKLNAHFSPRGIGKFGTVPEKTVRFTANYSYSTSTGSIIAKRAYDPQSQETHNFSIRIRALNDDAKKFFNVKETDLNTTAATHGADGTLRYDFTDMWNREFLFVHASFVNGTSFSYLGRSGEFYPKPSKMYKFAGGSNRFYFELSYDGRTPIRDKVADFCIDLAYIYYDKNYNAQ